MGKVRMATIRTEIYLAIKSEIIYFKENGYNFLIMLNEISQSHKHSATYFLPYVESSKLSGT